MLLSVDAGSSQAIHDQLAGQLRRAIADGTVTAGERLPAARELADGLGVNVHTVLRALQTVRDEGLVDIRRGRGTVVTGRAPRLAECVELARRMVVEARTAGLTNAEIRQALEAQL